MLRGDASTLASVSAADRAMLAYAVKLTTSPSRMSEDDVAALRAAGFDDQAILQINLIASWFNYVNRVADGLGVGHASKDRADAAVTDSAARSGSLGPSRSRS